jgi:hypothetical protein
MRYQQVYSASLFANVDPSLIYVTKLTFFLDPKGQGSSGVIVSNMQINLSTTTNAADALSAVFSSNVGADDTVVFGPGTYYGSFGAGFSGMPGDRQPIPSRSRSAIIRRWETSS